jgi:hypothetical protein
MPDVALRETARRWRLAGVLAGGLALAFAVLTPLDARQAPAAGACRVSGRVTSGSTHLPGVAIVVSSGDAVKSVTSTEPDGSYRLSVPPGTYRLTAELMGFERAERDLAVADLPCDRTLDLTLSLAPRVPRPAAAATSASAADASATPPARSGAPQPQNTAAQAVPGGRGAAPQRGANAGQRFETLDVETLAAGAAGLDVAPTEREGGEAARLLLPPGFSTDGPTQAVAINGNMASIDRGMMNERLDAIGRGEFDPITGAFGQGFGPGGQGFGPGGPGGRGGPGGPGGRGGDAGGFGGRGGPGGPDGFIIGGRGGRQNAYSAQSNYQFAGSALDSEPYELRPGSSAQQKPYTRQNFGMTVGGPVRIPGIYNGTRRTNFNFSYGGTRGGDLFDQYATVPTASMRTGDFSLARTQLVDPVTGLPFDDNLIRAARLSPSSLALLRFIPLPNIDAPGGRNYHYSTTNVSTSDNFDVRVTHNFTPNAGRGGRGGPGGRGGGLGGRGAPGGRGAAAARGRGQAPPTSVVMTAQVQYRRNDNDQNNVFPTLSGRNLGSSVSVPVSLNIQHRRMMHNVNVNLSRTESRGLNQYAYIENVAGLAGITGVATDPFDWGVPQLSFSTVSGVRDLTPSHRVDSRLTVGYGWTRPSSRHTLRIGGDVRFDRSDNRTDNNARGNFVFTGLYTSGGTLATGGGGLDFADFLLGVPQQASVQYGPRRVQLSGKSLSAYLQDDWRRTNTLTFSLGVRYELQWPFVEKNGQMVNLDANQEFTAVAPVLPGETGPYSGSYPTALMASDVNNVAPRFGFAWRPKPGNILRGGYGISYNAGSYSSIARQMVGQPPFAVTNNAIGNYADALSISDPFATSSPTETTNNYGVEQDYVLGVVQTANVDFSHDMRQVWNVGAGYTYTHGSSLDIVRAPNRGPAGLRIEGVQPFLWQTSDGRSNLHAGTFRLSRRPARGIGGGVSYTLARSRDDASTIGGGGTNVAQDDQDLEAEWALSSFDRRHLLSTNVNVEFPFGPNRHWLNQGGTWAALLRDWRAAVTFTWQSGTPLTPRLLSAATSVAQGVNGTLRGDYNGQPIQLSDPTIDRFFNTSAFSVPAPGLFGTAGRNMIIGPGSKLLNAQFSRDVRLGGNRAVTLQLNASNLLNLVNYGAVDTIVNSPTFGQVTSVRPMRSMTASVRFRF